MKTKLTATHLSGLKSLEGNLARQEGRQILQDLPPGHPLLDAIQDESGRGSDIGNLPDTHPLKLAIKEAKERLEAQQANEGQQQDLKIRKAKRLQESKEYQARVNDEEEQRQQKVDVCKVINEKIDISAQSIDTLLTVIGGSLEIFTDDPFARTRLVRLDRMMRAVRRGLTDSRMKTSRI